MLKNLQVFNSRISSFKLNLSLKKRYKVHLDFDMVFYDINYEQLNANFVYKESEFFDKTIEGIPAFLKLQISNSKEYIYYPDFDVSKLESNEKFAVLTYRYTQSFSTKFVLGVLCLQLENIKITNVIK